MSGNAKQRRKHRRMIDRWLVRHGFERTLSGGYFKKIAWYMLDVQAHTRDVDTHFETFSDRIARELTRLREPETPDERVEDHGAVAPHAGGPELPEER